MRRSELENIAMGNIVFVKNLAIKIDNSKSKPVRYYSNGFWRGFDAYEAQEFLKDVKTKDVYINHVVDDWAINSLKQPHKIMVDNFKEGWTYFDVYKLFVNYPDDVEVKLYTKISKNRAIMYKMIA